MAARRDKRLLLRDSWTSSCWLETASKPTEIQRRAVSGFTADWSQGGAGPHLQPDSATAAQSPLSATTSRSHLRQASGTQVRRQAQALAKLAWNYVALHPMSALDWSTGWRSPSCGTPAGLW